MISEELKNFSNELKVHREETGITLQQISQKTKIDIKFLKSIEESNFDVLPEIYIKAFIKEYAKCIDLNPIDVIKKYEDAKFGIEHKKVESKLVEENQKDTNATEDEIHTNNISNNQVQKNQNKINFSIRLNYVIGTLILIAALLILYYSIIYTPEKEIITETTETANKNDERFEVQKQDTLTQLEENLNAVIDDSLKLLVQTNDNVWIKVIKDGKNVHQKMTEKNSKLQFKAKEKFSVSVGNAGAVKIFFNNKEIKNIGKVGEIKNITITPDTIKFLTIKRNDKKPN